MLLRSSSRFGHRVALGALSVILLAPINAHAAAVPPRYTTPSSVVARAIGAQVLVRSRPDAAAPSVTLPNPWPLAEVDPGFGDAHARLVFLVTEQRRGWVRVLVPNRPNGSSGWIRTDDLVLTRTRYRVDIVLHKSRLSVSGPHGFAYQGLAAVGGVDTPTPTGRYFIRAHAVPGEQETFYGSAVLVLSAHSTALDTIRGGDASILIQGNNDSTVLGHAVSHGNVRIENDVITKLVGLLPPGTPVTIEP